MAAYVISEVEILDETQGQRYRDLAAESIAPAADTSSEEQLRAWYAS